MERNKRIEAEVRGIFDNAKWDRLFSKTASQIVEKIRKEKGFDKFTTKERVAIVESITQCLMNISLQHREVMKKLKREFIFVYIALLMLVNCIIILTLKVFK